MKQGIFLFWASGLLLATACKKEPTPEPVIPAGSNYLVFGYSGGYCSGDCSAIYRLEDGRLLHCKQEQGEVYEILPQAKYGQVKDLWDYIPPALLDEPEGIVGDNGGLADAGFTIIVYDRGGIHKKWSLDVNTPAYLHPFEEKVSEKVNMIN